MDEQTRADSVSRRPVGLSRNENFTPFSGVFNGALGGLRLLCFVGFDWRTGVLRYKHG